MIMELERSWTHPDRAEIHRLTQPGPWDDEPDKVQWIDAATGLDCLAVRNRSGNWCGYVGLPPGHPMHGQSADESDFEVHGGITFNGSLCDEDAEEGHGICHVPFPGRPAAVWWIGFDCGHFMDLSPAYLELGEDMRYTLERLTYRTLAYVRGECADLAKQLA